MRPYRFLCKSIYTHNSKEDLKTYITILAGLLLLSVHARIHVSTIGRRDLFRRQGFKGVEAIRAFLEERTGSKRSWSQHELNYTDLINADRLPRQTRLNSYVNAPNP